jgi:probable O-glycosylation ligase (exosortase A-associated)
MTLTLAHVFLLAMNPSVVTDPNNRNYILGASFLGDGNDFSLSLCLLFPFVVALALSTKKFWVRLFAWACGLLLLLAIIGTQSRGASLGVGAVLIFLWVHSSRKVLGVVAVGLVGVVVMIYAPPAYFARMNTIGNYQEDGSAQGRIEAWKASLHMAADHPLMGVGAGHFPVAFGTKYRTPGAANMPWLTAHSSYMLVLGELGIPGIVCLLALIIGNVRMNLRLRRAVMVRAGPTPDEAAQKAATLLLMASAAAVGLGVAGAFLSAAYYPHFYVLTGLLVSVRSLVTEQTGVRVDVATRRIGQARTQGAKRTAAP